MQQQELKTTTLGPRGYTLSKKEFTADELALLRKELTVKPFTLGSPMAVEKSFPAYRESDTRLYVPRYFGEKRFGAPQQWKLPPGQDIRLEFQGQLRDYQAPVVDKFLRHCIDGRQGGLLELYCAWGKTSSALFIASQLKKKTLVIVHKEFLMNQWIERIGQFLPSARIGKIQGQTMDVDGKDIVLCMLQSLVLKEYPTSLFESFGFTIIDEVHHISSESFSNALFKVVTPYMLGLSATMDRKDGTTKVFKMFLGEVVHKAVRDGDDDNVQVRCIRYENDDPEFNETVYDFRGNPQFSTMITKLCEYNRRSEFLLRVIHDMLQENGGKQQIMVLAHNRNLLTYIHDAIQHRQWATVGYYVGGMKEAALKATESKRVVVATYQMASEGLDIKTLSSVIFCTPKTSIEQSVGRILREKRSHQSIVVDVVDKHDIFQKQWWKRRRFYKSQGYKIVETHSHSYTPDISRWRVTSCPSKNNNNEEQEEEENFDEESNGIVEEEETKPTKCRILLKKKK